MRRSVSGALKSTRVRVTLFGMEGARQRAVLQCLSFVPANTFAFIPFVWGLYWFLSVQSRKLLLCAVQRGNTGTLWLQQAV